MLQICQSAKKQDLMIEMTCILTPHSDVSVNVNSQVTEEANQCHRQIINTNMSGGDEMLMPMGRAEETSVLEGLSSNQFAIIHDEKSSTLVDTCAQTFSC